MNRWLTNNPKDYAGSDFSEENLLANPFALFEAWFQSARLSNPETANIMHLATINAQHQPNCRIVLLKSMDTEGFVFFTNYQSVKANELNMQPYSCLNFFWFEEKRQVRIQGNTEQISKEDSDAYFASRPRESQLGAWASDQSTVIPTRQYLEQRYATLEKQYKAQDIPRPPHWGGYVVKPDYFEFWQGRDSRLHDRFQYVWVDDSNSWKHQRLSP